MVLKSGLLSALSGNTAGPCHFDTIVARLSEMSLTYRRRRTLFSIEKIVVFLIH